MKKLVLASLTLVLAAWHAGPARASFAREFERYNRERSFETVNELSREIEVRLDEEKKAEEEAKKEGEEPKEPPIEDVFRDRAAGWRIRPEMTFGVERDTNFFKRRTNAEPEVTYNYEPALRASTRFGDWRYLSRYEMTSYVNQHFPHNDRLEHNWIQSIERKGNKLKISVANELGLFSFPTEDANDELSDVKLNNFQTSIRYAHNPKIALTGYYRNQYTDFLRTDEKENGTHDNTFGGTVSYRLRPRLDGFFEYSYRLARPPKRTEASHINVQQFLLGFQGSLTPKIAVNLKGGIDSREFAATDDRIGLTAQAAALYQYSPKLNFSLTYLRDTVPSGQESEGDPLHQVVTLKGVYKIHRQWTLSAGESIRLVEAERPTTVIDPDDPQITTTKFDEQTYWETHLGAAYQYDRTTSMALQYSFQKAHSELKVDDRTSHITRFEVRKQF